MSRRLVLVAMIGIVMSPIGMMLNPPLLDIGLLRRYYVEFTFAQIVLVLIALPAALRKQEGRWAVYLYCLVVSAMVAYLFHLYGTVSTPLVASYTADVVVWMLVYDEVAGWIGMLAVPAAMIGFHVLEATHVLPYAPAVLSRSIETHREGEWFAPMLGGVVLLTAWAFFLCLLMISIRRMQEARLQQAQRLISRYIPSQLAERILRGEHAERFKPERVKLTVFFSDLEGFTEASDHLDPEDLAALLNEYLSEMVTIAERHGATINQIVGDGIMAFFGAPQATTDQDHALRAVRMALEMQQRLIELADIWRGRGVAKPFRARIGINTGYASVGDYGSEGRKLYSAIGIQTNLAARIQAHCEPGKVLIAHSTQALVHDEVHCTDRGELQFKGVHYPVRVYEVSHPS